jgi:hypothetical protein
MGRHKKYRIPCELKKIKSWNFFKKKNNSRTTKFLILNRLLSVITETWPRVCRELQEREMDMELETKEYERSSLHFRQICPPGQRCTQRSMVCYKNITFSKVLLVCHRRPERMLNNRPMKGHLNANSNLIQNHTFMNSLY